MITAKIVLLIVAPFWIIIGLFVTVAFIKNDIRSMKSQMSPGEIQSFTFRNYVLTESYCPSSSIFCFIGMCVGLCICWPGTLYFLKNE